MKKSLPLLLSLLTLSAASAATVSVSTVPFGFQTLTVPATTTKSSTTYLALPLLNPTVFSGAVTSVSTTSIAVAGTPWTAKQFAVAGSPFFVKVTSGKEAGRFLHITTNTNHVVTADVTDQSAETTNLNLAGFAVAVGDTFEIIGGDTLSTFLGNGTTANPLLLTGGTAVTAADTVAIYEPKLKKSLVYYFNTKTKIWTCTTAAGAQNNVVLYPETVLEITRLPNEAKLGFVVSGNVPAVAPLTKTIGAGLPVYGFTRSPLDLPLSSLNFTNWVQSNSVTTADTISIWNPTLAEWQVYYHLLNKGAVSGAWHLSGSTTNYSSLVIPSGTGFQITKLAHVSGATSFLAVPLTY